MKFKENDIRPDHLIKIGDKYFFEDARFFKKKIKESLLNSIVPLAIQKKKSFF